ncbi:hypothetical protein GCM10009119_42660 [Algoriphagus jejuensis]|uniref:PepSY domain-containing protein n=1 Tax=Algoriphagus jejuensis TaxID=419934 RepID=A0ABN1N5R1_9BACT
MQKIYSLLLLLVFVSFSFACKDEDGDPLDVFREIAFNSLTVSEKATVNNDWKQAEVGAWVDGYYLVVFESTDAGLADIRVVVDPTNGTVVEILPRI